MSVLLGTIQCSIYSDNFVYVMYRDVMYDDMDMSCGDYSIHVSVITIYSYKLVNKIGYRFIS